MVSYVQLTTCLFTEQHQLFALLSACSCRLCCSYWSSQTHFLTSAENCRTRYFVWCKL